MDINAKSFEELEKKLKENEYLTVDEWNSYAQKNGLFSSTTIIAHLSLHTFEDIKNKIVKSNNKINKEIEKVREELNKSVIDNGINSKEVRKLSDKIDFLINTYYNNNRNREKGRYFIKDNIMEKEYNRTYEHLKSLTIDLNEFPTISTWEEYAKKNSCLSSQAIQYISGLNWHKLRDKVKSDISFKSYKKIY